MGWANLLPAPPVRGRSSLRIRAYCIAHPSTLTLPTSLGIAIPSSTDTADRCRRRDSRPTSLQDIQTIQYAMHSPPPLSATNSYFDRPPPEIVPSMLPTVVRPMSQTFSELSLGDYNNSPSDHDSGSEAAYRECKVTNYLDQFYSGFSQSAKQQRPRTKRTSTTSTGTRSGGDSSTNLPSLSHSPSSSYGTVASVASVRPIMKQNPFSSTFTTKSVDLVMPHNATASTSPTQLLKDASSKSSASTLTSFRVAEASDTSYLGVPSPNPKRKSTRERADDNLKQLFRHDAMKASPKSSKHRN